MAAGRKKRKTHHIPHAPEDDAGQESESVIVKSPDDKANDEGEEEVPEDEREQWEAFREEQFEVIEQLPLSLHRMFALLRELDDRYQSYTKELEAAIREYVAYREVLAGSGSKVQASNGDVTNGVDVQTVTSEKPSEASDSVPVLDHPHAHPELQNHENDPSPSSGKSKTREMLDRIAWLNAESLRASEEKLALATTAYNSVDRHVRSLDSVITSEEAALVLGLRPGTRPVFPSPNGVANGGSALTPTNRGEGGSTTRKKRAGRFGRRAPGVKDAQRLRLEQQIAESQNQGEPPTGDVPQLDGDILPVVPNMTVDPNEPRYCYCNQVSYGVMVGCDNDECTREWFHYGCVGLTEAPKHRWFCRDCEVLLGKPSRKRKT